MKLKDKLIDPYSRRYWTYVYFIEKFLPTGFGVYAYKHIVQHNRMMGFIYSDADLSKEFYDYCQEIEMESLGSEVDAIFEDAE